MMRHVVWVVLSWAVFLFLARAIRNTVEAVDVVHELGWLVILPQVMLPLKPKQLLGDVGECRANVRRRRPNAAFHTSGEVQL